MNTGIMLMKEPFKFSLSGHKCFQLAWPSPACNPKAIKSHTSQDQSIPNWGKGYYCIHNVSVCLCVCVCIPRIRQIFKNQFSQQPLVGSYSNLKLKLIGLSQRVQRCQMKMTSNGRRPKMEDDLKIWKVEYLSNHWPDLAQIWNFSL